ncbi:2-hydroxycarboxylate transporter family protein [Methylobacterium persicinum]|uniref:CCS family citrate carrier protein n=1 Tax=Methylobacterium persicinum TaxID=374426 RepID=A0ABU0HKJ2_9HYPH|nr:2-hydroxycarboxylate transporter family protein [Methylobacterium persicinum]MDQ0442363.1 CCS family citrate carrier protein [Methylobacterium persicinum]GJE37178.1 Citrate/malate transporter [Methylobacterium persicinum]
MSTAASTPSPATAAPITAPASRRFWPEGWWRVIDMKIGIIPLPVYVILAGLIAILVQEGEIKPDGPTMIAVLAMGGFTCAEIGKRIPILRNIGAGAIFATFIPSALVYYKFVPPQMEKAIIDFTKFTNFLYIYIATIIVGSILGMDREVLIKGFLKIFAPLAIGSVAAGLVGTLVGTLLGIGAYKTFFFIVVPIMAGGVGEGAIPLSIGYAAILGTQQGVMFAQVLPPVMLGSLTAIVLSGTLNYVGKKRPHLTGNGKLQPDADEMKSSDAQAKSEAARAGIDPATIGAAGLTAITLYLLGVMCHHLVGLPAPVAMLFLAVFAKLASAVSPRLQAGGFVVYKFVQVSMTYPLLFAIGVALTPWKELMAAFTLVNLITIIATVGTLMTVGFFVGRALNMYPIETAIVNACHSGQGGTGDVAILTAADRMALMPFAQIATRIGGALTVTGTLIVMKWISG